LELSINSNFRIGIVHQFQFQNWIGQLWNRTKSRYLKREKMQKGKILVGVLAANNIIAYKLNSKLFLWTWSNPYSSIQKLEHQFKIQNWIDCGYGTRVHIFIHLSVWMASIKSRPENSIPIQTLISVCQILRI